MPLPTISIHYVRPPGREQVFRQLLVHDAHDVKVTLARGLTLERPVVIDGEVALETGSDAVWFTFPGTWHDIGRFHTADGAFTGIYTNILTPPVMDGRVWHTTDLFLDLWLPSDGGMRVLDREELEEALRAGWIDGETHAGALTELERILALAADALWPPDVVGVWTRERALGRAEGG